MGGQEGRAGTPPQIPGLPHLTHSFHNHTLNLHCLLARAAHVPSLFGTGDDTGNPVKLLPDAEPEPKVRGWLGAAGTLEAGGAAVSHQQ